MFGQRGAKNLPLAAVFVEYRDPGLIKLGHRITLVRRAIDSHEKDDPWIRSII